MSFPSAFEIALAAASFLKPRERLTIAATLDAAGEASLPSLDGLSILAGRALKARAWDPAIALERAKQGREWLVSHGAWVLKLGEAGYPALLSEIYDPPAMLFGRGELPAETRPWIAVVGTRDPGAEAAVSCYALCQAIGAEGVAVVSGLARGMDARAHAGALAGGGRTVAVMGTGIDRIYPASNKGLAGRILESGGCILSEYPPGEGVERWRFPERNRIIAGLCRLVLVAEAPAKSGALITVEHALQEGRDVAVCAFGMVGERGAGCAKLASEGAPIVRDHRDALALLGMAPSGPAEAPRSGLAAGIAARLREELALF